MAFIFVPNADGSFTEGDRQTNPDTGVEYIYIDGAWRALGPKIQDEFDTLDGRYVKLESTSILGDYYRLRGPNAAGTGFNSFVTITDGEQKLYNVALAEDTNTGWAASVQYVQNYVQNAVGDVDLSEYLPLAGGTMTGDLNMESADIEMLNSRIDFYNSSGDRTMEIAASGFIKSRDMLRVVRASGPILEGRTSDSASDVKVKIESDGYFMFRDRGELYGDIYLKDNKRYIVQGAARTNVAQFYARTDNIARFESSVSGKTIEIKGVADPVDNRDAVNLQYLNGLPFATEDYVDTAIEHDLTDDGLQDLEPNSWTVKQKNQAGNNRTCINIYDGEMHLYNVADPTNGADGWAVNKAYVDTLFSSSGGGSYLPLTGGDLTGKVDITMDSPSNAAIRTIGSINVKGDSQEIGGSNNFIAHKDYVRVYSTPSHSKDVVNKEYLDNYKKPTVWKAVDPSTPAGNLQVGEFFVADNNNLYLHFKSNNGIDLGVAGGEYAQSMTYLASIYATGTYNSVYSTVADKINFNVSSNNYIRVQSSHLLYKQAMNIGTNYAINIPGFTP